MSVPPDSTEVTRIIQAALAEDIGAGDVTATLLIPENQQAALAFVAREPLVACGGEIVRQVFAAVNTEIQVQLLVQDGQQLAAGARMIEVSGPARAILTGERVALNLLQRMCAVASLTAQYVEAVAGTRAVILDTRKTMPGLRALDKYAVRAGGGRNHRMRLDDMILIKDNHIRVCGGVGEALRLATAGNKNNLRIEVECDTLAQVEEAIAAGAKLILLDNMDNASLKQAVVLGAGKVEFEASGNVSLATVRAIAETGVDFISVGRITHSAGNVDIGLDMA